LKSRSTVRVRYAETDKLGVVYHSNYFVYFEIGRTEYFRQAGFSYREMEDDRIAMPVTECGCRYYRPAVYDDELEIVTELNVLSRLRLRFSYEVFRTGDGSKLADGFTVHVPVNPQGRPCRIPPRYLSALNPP
jgi:acyl-CoA thioester hydrolase